LITIRLNSGEWTFDPADQLGPKGGFGVVYRGMGPDGPVAVKQLALTASQAAHREMQIGEAIAARALEHVVPILDFGQDADSDRYYLIMPICEYSLQDKIQSGPLDFYSGRLIIFDIVSGLLEVGDLVHRDLKPGNILFHEGKWKIADFGIAKFVEDSTSLLTLREALTPSYAAPEQWDGLRPTHSTDVYALACVAYTVFGGSPPFSGDAASIRDGHLHRVPPPLLAPPSVRAVFTQALRKAPEGRPTLGRIQDVLKRSENPEIRPALARLAHAAQAVASEKSRIEAAAAEQRAAEGRHRILVLDAVNDFHGIKDRLFQEILDVSSDVDIKADHLKWGEAHLQVFKPTSAKEFSQKISTVRKNQGWDILVATEAKLICNESKINNYVYGASLFFGRRTSSESYRWHEVSFWTFSAIRNQPTSLDMFGDDAAHALSSVMHIWSVAFGPAPIDGEDEDTFQDRWLTLIARAAAGDLQRPDRLPPPKSFYE
jgi:serine/threonine protein kinase